MGWYFRYWDSMSLAKDIVPTYVVNDWNEAIENDPLFSTSKKAPQKESEVKNDSIINNGDFDMDFGAFLGDNDE